MAHTSESEALDRLRNGDHEALGALFALHRQRLWQVARFRIDPRIAARVDVDDVLQETFLDAAARISHYFENPPGTFFVWLRTIATQTIADLHRRHLLAERRSAQREVQVAPSFDDATSTTLVAHLINTLTTPSEAAIRSEMTEQVEQAIAGMEPIDREVLALRHFEELTNGEVAEVLNVSPATASARYVRAISRLQSQLAVLGQSSPEERATESSSRRAG